tara:strand:+ start:511 stop:975 length:465 start_codon:yes stop_codon:yes gene_type:complete
MININKNIDINQDLNIYENIIKKYNLYQKNIDLIHKIYLISIKINKSDSDLKKNINKINKLKIEFSENMSKWQLEDSCNKHKIKNTVKNIKNIHKIITYLNYINLDLIDTINSYKTKIKHLIDLNCINESKKNNSNNSNNSNINDEYENFIINN